MGESKQSNVVIKVNINKFQWYRIEQRILENKMGGYEKRVEDTYKNVSLKCWK